MGRPPKHQSTPTGRAAVNAALLLTLCGLAAPGLAQNWHWSGAMGDDWSVPFNWLPNGLPPEASHVRIGSLANVENATVHLDMPDTVGALTITDGMSLSTGSRSLAVLGDASISGRNIVDFGGFDVAYASTLDVGPVDGNSFGADDLTLSDGGTFRLRNQAYTRVAGRVTVGVDTGVRGNGTLTLQGAGVTLVNDGIIDPGTEGSLRLQQIGGGLYDLDGTSGAGKLGLGVYDTIDDRGPRLRIDGTALSDGFSGEIQMTSESELAMNLSDGWAADSNSSIWIAGAYEQEGGPAVIRGGEFEFAGELDVTGQEWGRLRVEPERFILRSEARVTLANETQADFGADAGTEVLIRGGEFNIGANAVLHLNGSTKWDGDVLATGVVRQMDEASVTGPQRDRRRGHRP